MDFLILIVGVPEKRMFQILLPQWESVTAYGLGTK